MTPAPTRVLHSTFSLTRRGGGVYEVMKDLTRELSQSPDLTLKVVGPYDPDIRTEDWHCESDSYQITGPPVFGYSRQLPEVYRSFRPQLCHLHGVWMYYSKANLDYCRRNDVPFLISPHGMLDRWALKNSGWKKRIVRWLFEDKHLSQAACLHALCESEAEEIRNLGLRNPICVIPNGVTIAEETSKAAPWSFEPGRPVMLFLSRLHPKKGLLEFLSAWHEARELWQKENWAFAIAGWDQSGYADQLREKIAALGMTDDVKLIGPVFGEDKQAVFQNAAAFVLPSFSEGLPVAVLEAWACRLPVLMTDRCNLPVGFDQKAATRIADEPSQMAAGVQDFFETSPAERRQMGIRGRTLVDYQFTWPTIAERYQLAYDACLTGASDSPLFLR